MKQLGFLFLMLFSTVLFSCKTTQEINRKRSNLDKLTPQEILVKNSTNPKMKGLLAIKSKVYFKTPKLSDSFKMHIRMKRDSIIWISATYYKVEVARFVFTQDSVKMIDRKNEKYYLGGYTFIQNLYNVPFNFSSLQATILGEPYDQSKYKKVRSYTSKGNYIVAGLSELEFKKPKGEIKTQQQIYTEWYAGEEFLIAKSKISESKTKKSFTSEILERKTTNGIPVPVKANYVILGAKRMSFEAENLKITQPETQSYPLSISLKYESLF
ncbi:MAG: hypothetical protein ACJASM_000440 [Salibacteraceae bacterium]|jgi:hypothetical protein